MKCFNHSDDFAVGVCKSCSKGICRACAFDTKMGLACTDACIEEVEKINQLMGTSTNLTSVARRATYFTPLFLLFMGIVMSVYGYNSKGLFNFTTIMGAGFIIFGIASALGVLWARKKPNEDSSK